MKTIYRVQKQIFLVWRDIESFSNKNEAEAFMKKLKEEVSNRTRVLTLKY